MSLSPSEFKPTVTSFQGNEVRIIDPNPGQEIVPHEDMFIFVSLKAKQKSKSILTETDSPKVVEITNENKSTIDLASPQIETFKDSHLFRSKPYLSTDWTEIGGTMFKSDRDLYTDYEGFSITNIDIEIKSQTSPKVTINFTDIRGATLFEQGSCSPYGLFFNLPYPIFELTVKGYYGRPVNYYLNLVKFNTKFNSETGNMECTAEFIGYTFAFLADTIVGYVAASQFLDDGKYAPQEKLRSKYSLTRNFYIDNNIKSYETTNPKGGPWCDNAAIGNGKCTTIYDLLQQYDRFEDIDKKAIGQSPEYIELQNLNSLLSLYEEYKSEVLSLINTLQVEKKIRPYASTSDYKGNAKFYFNTDSTEYTSSNGLLHQYFNTKNGILAGKITNIITQKVTESQYGGDVLKNSPKKLLTTYVDKVQDLINLQSSQTPDYGLLYDVLKNSNWHFNVLTRSDINLNYSNSTNTTWDDGKAGSPFIDFGYIIDAIEKDIDYLIGDNGVITKKREAVTKEINRIIESRLGFYPTIRNIFTVLLCNTDAFMEIMLDVYLKAEQQHKSRTYDEYTNGSSTNILLKAADNTGNDVIYPWPTFFKKFYTPKNGISSSQGTREDYPGEEFPTWWEVIFVEDFIKAYMKWMKAVELLNEDYEDRPGYDNYVPINPIESTLIDGRSPNKYLGNNNANDYLKIAGERIFIGLDHSLFQPIRVTEDVLNMPLFDNTSSVWNPLKDSLVNNSTSVVKSLGKIEAWNILNSQEGSEGSKILRTLQTQFNNSQSVIDSVKTQLGTDLTVKKASEIKKITLPVTLEYNGKKIEIKPETIGFNDSDEYYVYTPKDSDGKVAITINGSDGGSNRYVRPNPHDMDSGLLIKIIDAPGGTPSSGDEGGIRKINIKQNNFISAVKSYETDLGQSTKSINYKTDDGYSFPETSLEAKYLSDTSTNGTNTGGQQGYFVPSYSDPLLFTTLGMSRRDANSLFGANNAHISDWAGNSKISDLDASYMGTLTYWDYNADNTIEGISFLSDERKQNDIFNSNLKGFDGDNFPSLQEQSENSRKDIEPEDTVTSIGHNPSTTIDGIATSFVTTPLWLDNVNKFRKSAGGTELDPNTQNKNLAYLFLHTLKPSPFISRYVSDNGKLYDGTQTGPNQASGLGSFIHSLRNLCINAGVSQAPKLWVLSLGAELWRWKTFVGTKNVNGKTLWNKPLTCKSCGVGDKPTGMDPLAQPGFNSIYVGDGGTDNGYNKRYISGSTEPFERNDLPLYLKTIYGLTNVTDKVEKSVFSPNYQGRLKGQQVENGAIPTNSGRELYASFRYYNIYRDKLGKLSNGPDINDNPFYSTTIVDEVKNYSWPGLWIAPHHIPYVNPEIFDDRNDGAGSCFVWCHDGNLGDLDYLTTMSETYDKKPYSDSNSLSDTDKNTSRNKLIDGNLGMILQYIPDQVKDDLVKNFEDWVTNQWVNLLPIVDPINFQNSSITPNYYYSSTLAKEQLNHDKVVVLSLNPKEQRVIDLKKSLLEDQCWLVSTTPKMWYGIGGNDDTVNNATNSFYDGFLVSKKQFDAYFTSLQEEFTKNVGDKIKELEDKERKDRTDNGNILDDDDIKLSLYRTFKSISDKWISASSKPGTNEPHIFFNLIEKGNGSQCKGNGGSRKNTGGIPDIQDGSNTPRSTLAAHFQYVNRVMGDIGDKAVIDIKKLKDLQENPKLSLYQYLTDMLTDNNYLFFPLPAYVNFTGNGLSNDDLIDMFRPVNDMSSISCGPLFLSMYVGGSSRQLMMKPNANCSLDKEALSNLEDDSFSIYKQINDPSKSPAEFLDPSKDGNSQGFTTFNVVYGKENQNHFTNIQLDQAEFSETAESLQVIDKLSQQGGSDKTSKGQNLNAMYLTRSYTCQVESLGNMMIQPMTYFDLIGVPMFSGAYLITEVRHNFTANHAKTTFKGVRQPRMTTPIVTDAAVAMNIDIKTAEGTVGASLTTIGGKSTIGNESFSGGGIAKVQKQPGGTGVPTTSTAIFNNTDTTQLDAYGGSIGITDKSDQGTLFNPNQPTNKPIGNMVNSAYANLNVSTRGVPGTQNGNLGCASAVSIIFYRATGYALVGNDYINISTQSVYDYLDTESVKPNSSWQKITNWETDSKPGDIICTRRGTEAGHIGIVVNDGKVISNSSGGFQGDKKGQIELNYSLSAWKTNVYPRNPTQTASFRYKGPYASTWGVMGNGISNVTSSGSIKSKNPNKLCGSASANNVDVIYPKSTLWRGSEPPIVNAVTKPTISIDKNNLPIVSYIQTIVTPQDYIREAEKIINKLAPTVAKDIKKKILTSAYAIGRNEQTGPNGGFKGFNNNLTGVESSGFKVFDSKDVTGRVQAREGGTNIQKYYYSFSSIGSGLIPVLSKIIDRNMFGGTGLTPNTKEENEWAWRYFRDWNGFGGRTLPDYQKPNYDDCNIINNLESVYNNSKSYVSKYTTFN